MKINYICLQLDSKITKFVMKKMIYYFFLFCSIILIVCNQTFGQENFICKIKENTHFLNMAYSQKEQSVYVIHRETGPKPKKIFLSKYSNRLELIWEKTIITDYVRSTLGKEAFLISVFNDKIFIFYSKSYEDKAGKTEFILVYDSQGNSVKSEELFEYESCDIVKKFQDENNIVLIPFKFKVTEIEGNNKNYEYANSQAFLPISVSNLHIFRFNLQNENLEQTKAEINIDNGSLFKITYSDHNIFSVLIKKGCFCFLKINYLNGNIEEIKFENTDFNQTLEVINGSNTNYYFTERNVLKVQYKKPSYFELQNSNKETMGSLLINKYGFDGTSSENNIKLSSDIITLTKKYGEKNKIDKEKLLQGFILSEINFLNGIYYIFIERLTYESKTNTQNTTRINNISSTNNYRTDDINVTINSIPYSGEFITYTIDSEGNEIGHTVTDRYAIRNNRNLFLINNEKQTSVLFFGEKKYTKEKNGFYSLQFDLNGKSNITSILDVKNVPNYMERVILIENNEIIVLSDQNINFEILKFKL